MKLRSYLSGNQYIWIFIFAFIVGWVQFYSIMPRVFYGDDLSTWLQIKNGQCGVAFSELLTSACGEKYRPLSSFLVLLIYKFFDTAISHYMVANMMIFAVSIIFIYKITKILSGGNIVVSTAISLAVASSRFAVFQVTQAIGSIEGLALLLFVILMYIIIRVECENVNTRKFGFVALFLYFLLLNTHERYIVVGLWLILAFNSIPNFYILSKGDKARLNLTAMLIPIGYISYKIYYLHIPIMVGTGGTHITFEYLRIIDHSSQALLSIVGFNHGPDYLVGIDWTAMALVPDLMAVGVFSGLMAFILIFGIYKLVLLGSKTSEVYSFLRMPLLLLFLFFLLLIPAVSTIRVEQRWLFPSFIIALLICVNVSYLKFPGNNYLATWLIVLMAGVSIIVDGRIINHFNNVYMVYSAKFAEMVKRDIVLTDSGSSSPLFLLANKDHCNWTLIKGGFFELYGGKTRDLTCVANSTFHVNDAPEGSRFYTEFPSGNLIDVTDALRAREVELGNRTLYDFLVNFDKGKISDNSIVSSPSGRGAMVFPVETPLGKVNTLTLVSGFSYRYDDVQIENNCVLKFGLSMIYKADPIRAIVKVFDSKGNELGVIFDGRVESPAEGRVNLYQPISRPLDAYSGQRVSIVFFAENAGGSPNSQWLSFSMPLISQSSVD